MCRYRLNVLGAQTYLNLLALYEQGRELNLRKWQRGKQLQKMDSYMGFTPVFIEVNS